MFFKSFFSFSVQILAEEGAAVDNLDLSSARDLLTKANSQVSSASTDEAKAEAMIQVEVAEALVKAAESAWTILFNREFCKCKIFRTT